MSDGPRQARLKWGSRTLAKAPDAAALRRWIGRDGRGAMLESVAGGRFSIYGIEPRAEFRADARTGGDPFLQIRERWGAAIELEVPCPFPFVGGWIGFLGYEAGAWLEPRAGRVGHEVGGAGKVPLSRWAFFDSVLIHDLQEQRWHAVGVEADGGISDLDAGLGALSGFAETIVGEGSEDSLSAGRCEGEWNYSREAYLEKVERALEYIRAGDIFQVNIARRFRSKWDRSPMELYERLRRSNASEYAAYLPLDGSGTRAILSSSPELFLSVDGREVVTRPIKGTRPRTGELARDEMARRELATCAKERAELNMIIDLERNDLGRVCEFGSVVVEHEGEIEAHPTVFHRAATIRGRLREGVGAVDLLRATFPGGSITGAPKVRAMQIISELEPDPRGAYCGAIGYFGVDGRMQLNLAIRTMVVADGHADLFVGSGIVADSEPLAEYRELAAKAAGMMAALGCGDGGRCSESALLTEQWHAGVSSAATTARSLEDLGTSDAVSSHV